MPAPEPGAGAPVAVSLGRQSLIYGGGLVFSRLLAFLMLPVYTNYLEPSDYGTLQLLMLTFDVLAVAAGARLAGGIFVFHARTSDPGERQRLISTTLLLLGATYGSIGLLVFLGAEPLSRLVFGGIHRTTLLRLAGGAFAFDGIMLVGLTVLQVRALALGFVVITVARQLVQVGLNLVTLIGLGWGIEGMMGATLVANVVFGTGLTLWLLAQSGVHYSPAVARQLAAFGIPLVGTQVATMVAAYGDRYVLGLRSGLDAVGIYALAAQFGTLVFTMGFAPFNQVWEPRRFEVVRRPDGAEQNARAFRYCNLVLITLGFAIALFVGDYLRIVSPPAFQPAAGLVPVIVVTYLLMAWSDFQNVGILIRERTGLIAVANWVCAGVAWIGYLWAIPRWGAQGAAAAALVAYLVRQILQYRFSQRLFPLRYDWAPVARQFAYAAVLLLAAFLLPQASVPQAILFHLVLLATYLVAVGWGGVMSRADRAVLLGGVRRFLQPRVTAAR